MRVIRVIRAMRVMRSIPLAELLLTGWVLAAGCGGEADDDRDGTETFVIGNRSSHTLAELRVAAVADRGWVPNLLASPLRPGADVIAARIPCAHYDVAVTRDDGAHCVLPNTALCFAGEPWRIHDVTLETCLWQQ